MSRRRLIFKLETKLGLVKVYRDAEWDEYRVVHPDGGTSHHSDRGDAMSTATYIASHITDAMRGE